MKTAATLVTSAIFGLSGLCDDAAEVGLGNVSKHISETATVCDVVASARLLSGSRRQPTLLNLGEPYPDDIFTVVIFGPDHAKFGTPETTPKDKYICETGKIQEYHRVPEIILSNPSQLKQ